MADEPNCTSRDAVLHKQTGIEKLLRARQELDEQLKAQFVHNVTVMFTDIQGSTAFFETYGDIEGRLMVQKHNELLFPCIQTFQGDIFKTIGDAIMAGFEKPVDAVRAAVAMQLGSLSQQAQTTASSSSWKVLI